MSNVYAIDPSNALSFTGFGGPEQQTFGTGFRARSVLYGERYRELDRKQSFYECTQHDSKMFDFDGRIASGPRSVQPLLSAEKAHWYVPLKMRRPSAPYRLGKIIVDSFTNLLFGEQRFPAIRVADDVVTEDYMQTISRVGKLPLKMIQARNYGGAMGTVGMSWCFREGKPRYEVHNAKNLFIHSWEDRVELIVRHATEVYQFYKVQWNGKEFAKTWFWFRRDWTKDWDIVFHDVPVEKNKDPVWIPDMKKSVNHNDGLCHLVWIQNLPCDEVDGCADFDGLYESFDTLDLLVSVVSRGATLNLDPTLKLKMDPDLVNRMGVKKGSDNALVVGKDGDAEYMELGGSSIEAGVKLIDMKRRSILEAAQCIVPDPHEVAAQGVSSVAIKAMFAPMLGKADVLREQYSGGMIKLLEGPTVIARKASRSTVVIQDPATGEPAEGQFFIDLPPKIEKQVPIDPATGGPVIDPQTGMPLPEYQAKIPRVPGEGMELEFRWPPYFPPTPDDQAKIATTLQTATGGKAFLSKQTAAETMASAFGVDPAGEWERISEQGNKEKEAQGGMFPPGAGGEVGGKDELPEGTVSRETVEEPPAEGAPPEGA